MKRLSIEDAFAVVVLYLSTGVMLPLLLSSDPSVGVESDGNRLIQAVWAAIYLLTVLLLARRWRQSLWLFTRDKALIAIILLACASTLWSVAPEVTMRRSVALLGTTLVGVYLAQRYSIEELIRLLAWAFGLAAITSVVFSLALPMYGIMTDQHAGAWRGAFIHKNHLGRYMSLGAIVFILLGLRRSWVAIAGACLCVALVLASTSKSAMVVLGISAWAITLYLNLRRDLRLTIPIVLVSATALAVAAGWIAMNYESVLAGLGRDATLTGRTFIWMGVLRSLSERPWLGYGYQAFWTADNDEAMYIWSVFWGAYHSHNGYLDLLLNVGVIGAVLFVWCFVKASGRAVVHLRETPSMSGLWPLLILTFLAVYNVGESLVMQRNDIFWMLFVSTVAHLGVRIKQTDSEATNPLVGDAGFGHGDLDADGIRTSLSGGSMMGGR